LDHPEEEPREPGSEAARVAPEDAPHSGNGSSPQAESDRKWRDLSLFLPRLLKLIGRLVTDPEVPALDKVVLGAAVLYVVGPFDLVPDSIPVLGQLDDLYLLAICLLRLLNQSGPDKLRQYWDGPEDIVALLQEVTDLSTRFLPQRVRGIIHNWVRARTT
jgi:uncharacterized membrane protein YkvA (DUF1232 family)